MEINKLSLNVGVWLAVVLVAIGLFELKKTEKTLKNLSPPEQVASPPGRVAGVDNDFITVSAANGCLQNGVAGLVEVGQYGVCWLAPSKGTACEIQFEDKDCPPFKDGKCDFICVEGQVCSGPPNDAARAEYRYGKFTDR